MNLFIGIGINSLLRIRKKEPKGVIMTISERSVAVCGYLRTPYGLVFTAGGAFLGSAYGPLGTLAGGACGAAVAHVVHDYFGQALAEIIRAAQRPSYEMKDVQTQQLIETAAYGAIKGAIVSLPFAALQYYRS
jgi:hypothetical protein